MDLRAQLLAALDRAYDGRSWHGSNLKRALRGLTPHAFAVRFGRWTGEAVISGVAAHDLYHAGQIQLLRKLAAGTIFTIPALFLWGVAPPYLQVVVLCFLGAALGLSAMIPLRRLLIVDAHAELPYPEGTACAGSIVSSLVLIPLIAFIGQSLAAPLAPETVKLVSAMSTGEIWSRYVRYIGAGAVAAAGILTVLRYLPTMAGAFLAVATRIVGIVGVSSQPTSDITLVTLIAVESLFAAAGWTDGNARAAVLTVGTIVAIAASKAGDIS